MVRDEREINGNPLEETTEIDDLILVKDREIIGIYRGMDAVEEAIKRDPDFSECPNPNRYRVVGMTNGSGERVTVRTMGGREIFYRGEWKHSEIDLRQLVLLLNLKGMSHEELNSLYREAEEHAHKI